MTWKVPYTGFPLQFEAMEPELVAAFRRVMKEGAFILRSDVQKFESDMAAYLNVRHVIGVNSGTDALYLALRVAGVKEGDEVITVKHTFIATISAIRSVGAKPVFVDVGNDYCMDVDKVQAAVTSRSKAILPVHLNGRMCAMTRITGIAEKNGLLIIEDAAQSLGASIHGRKAGAWGLFGCFSTHPMKILGGAGDGGFISTNDDAMADRLRDMRNHRGEPYGFNSRLDNLQAALLNVKLPKLDDMILRRREIAGCYDRAFADIPARKPPAPNGAERFDTFNSYVLADGALREYLRDRGIEAFSHLSEETTSLPIYPEMKPEQVAAVISAVRGFYA